MRLLRTLAVTFALYSRIPMPHFEWKEEDMRYSIAAFPLVGAVIGLVFFGVSVCASRFAIPDAAAALLLTAVPLIITGGFHADGFMDVADALSSFRTREEKLEILKDPHIGAFAVIRFAVCGLIYIASLIIVLASENAGILVTGIAAGFALSRSLSGLAVLFVLLLGWQKTINKAGGKIIDWLAKKKIVKRPDYWKERLSHSLEDYGQAVKILKGNVGVLVFTYLMNLLQRFCQTIISSLTYLATGGVGANVRQVYASQCFSTMGSVCTPVPGGMGIADYILYDSLRTLMDKEASLQLELLSRSFSFYLMVLISLIIVIVGYILKKTHYFTLRTTGRW